MNLPAIDPVAMLRPRRKITGFSAILLPFTAGGEPDWTGFRAHVRRTLDAGLGPAVNMDTGYGNLIDDATKIQVLDITREEAMRGLIGFGRIEEMLARTRGRIDHVVGERVTPFAAPLFLEVGKVPVEGAGAEALVAAEAARLMAEAGLG